MTQLQFTIMRSRACNRARGGMRATGFALAACGLWMGTAAAQIVPQEAYTARKAAQQAVRATNGRNEDASAPPAQPANQPGSAAAASRPAAPAAPADGSHRDPFSSIIRGSSDSSPCAAGKKCLQVDQVVLKGVIKAQDGMIAMVENQHRKSYFLREKDPVFNGAVVKITDTAIVFRESVIDRAGRVKSREVVKRLGEA